MNWYFTAAGALAFLVGLIHSVLGEVLIFHRLRRRGVVSIDGAHLLGERLLGIIWASWHVLTVFGWGMAALLVWLAGQSSSGGSRTTVEQVVAVSMLVGAGFVFVGTKGRHPGWVGLLGVAVLVWLGHAG